MESSNMQKTFRTEYLPDPWLEQYEDEEPGYIRSIRGDLSNCYIKEMVQVPLYRYTITNSVRKLTHVGFRTAYVWTQIQ